MKPIQDAFIPKNYDEELPKLKDKYFSWRMEFVSKSAVANKGTITHFEINGNAPHGNFVLVPGLASNTETEPLMCAMMYWALKHKYNVYALDSFLGNFQPTISADLAQKNTLPEFIDLMDVGLEIVSQMANGGWTCVVGHSLGATGTVEVFNRRVQKKQPIGFSGAILFAPFFAKEWAEFTKDFINHYQCHDLPYEEFYKKPIGLVSPHDVYLTKQVRYISAYPKIYDDLCNLKPRPDLMAQYNIPVTLVAGGQDKKSPIEYIRSIYNQVNECSPTPKMRFVEFPESKHSFMYQHEDWQAILRLIKTQHMRAKRQK